MHVAGVEIEKSLTAELVPAIWGTIDIRLVVVKAKPEEGPVDLQGSEEAIDDDLPPMEDTRRPLESYLEKKGGHGYVAFLVNGQRHDQLDEWFVGRDLGFKYLKGRTMIVVEVDGLSPEAIAQLLQSSRQGFYKGDVWDAMHRRLVAVLKNDPDLKQLEADAEQAVSELRSGDAVVRRKLDELIEGHHNAAEREQLGTLAPGATGEGGSKGTVNGQFVVEADPETGEPGHGPVLVCNHAGSVIRLHPNEKRTLKVTSFPEGTWGQIREPQVVISPTIPELKTAQRIDGNEMEIDLNFVAAEDFPSEDYPVVASLAVSARISGAPEPRLLERELMVSLKKPREPRPPQPLRVHPTFLRVISRQPVKLQPGGAFTHVRLRWDGEDELVNGLNPSWRFTATCLSLNAFPTPVFSQPRGGNFEVLLETPVGLLPGHELDFQITATGPSGAILATPFKGTVSEPPPSPEPRRVAAQGPVGAGRKAPYDLVYIKRDEWKSGTVQCWGQGDWTEDDAGCFLEPTQSKPLVLVLNEDARVLKAATDKMLDRKLEPSTVKERTSRYQAHVALHLYRMYLDNRRAQEQDDDAARPSEYQLRAEINRVAATLSDLMA
jgi:hypothetical protein